MPFFPFCFLYVYYKTKARFPTFSTPNLFSALNGENILLHLIAKQQQQKKRKKKSEACFFMEQRLKVIPRSNLGRNK